MNGIILISALIGGVSVLFFGLQSWLNCPEQAPEQFSEVGYLRAAEERELRFEKFAAWTECPSCLFLDLHRIKDTLPHSCRRICGRCKYVWRQV